MSSMMSGATKTIGSTHKSSYKSLTLHRKD